MCFYLTSDGFTDQLGGERYRVFGMKKFKQILIDNHTKPFEEQRELLLEAFKAHKADGDRQDDVTLIGCSLTRFKPTVILMAEITFHGTALENKSQWLDAYLKIITPDIEKNEGQINITTPDVINIFISNQADAAIDISVLMQKKLRKLQADNQGSLYGIKDIRIGIYTCTLAVRSFDELQTIDKEIIGSEVNLTHDLASLNKKLGTSTLICDTTFSKLRNIANYNHRFIGRVKNKKKREYLAVFEVFDTDLKSTVVKKKENLEEYDRGIFYYNSKNFKKAVSSFQLVLDSHPEDTVAAEYLGRSKYFQNHESPPDWEFIEVLNG